MLMIYKSKKDMPQDMEYVELNDIFFNKVTAAKLDKQAEKVIMQIDGAKLVGQYKIESRFNGVTLDIDKLSTGCKTVLNVMYFPKKIFCLKECGDNALDVLYHLEQGSVYSDYAAMPFTIDAVEVVSSSGKTIIDNYEDLKEWWNSEE